MNDEDPTFGCEAFFQCGKNDCFRIDRFVLVNSEWETNDKNKSIEENH